MDKRTVFADGLVLPRALKVLDHGVLVGEPPHLWFMHDTNGDLKADTKELVTDATASCDSNVEHNANRLLWALDNWMHTSEVDTFLRCKNGKFEVDEDALARAVGRQRRTTPGMSTGTRTSRRCTSTWCRPLLRAQPEPDADAGQLRVPRPPPTTT